MDVFDLTQSLDRIRPIYEFDGLFAVIGLVMLATGVAILRFVKQGPDDFADRIRRMGWFFVPFAALWLAFVAWMGLHDIDHAYAARREVAEGRYSVVEGCLDDFRPGDAAASRTTAGNERWRVAGREFSYGAGEVRFGYHAVEPRGGIVHADSRVKVFFVEDEFLGREDIVRLESQPHACPAAPDAP